ncbi:MAG: lysophospholipid acyltransferase family protein, partial [Thermoanaerobaculia bacterium]|nr:lysophospholipid acyltransferase family protein [Thermoanaerobaculia bacterium]
MSSLGDRLIPLLAALLIRIIYATMRIRHVGYGPAEELRKQGTRYILAFWHAHLLLMVFAKYEPPIVTMISRHRDGELIARTVSYFGARSTRGSTTRGGATALRGLIAAARAGATLAITPDGPRGPRHVAQTGTVHAAQATGLPIVPVAFISHPKIRFRSWDRFEVPWLFSRGVFLYGEPIA